MTSQRDFLDEITEERTAANAAFPDLVQTAMVHRELARQLAEARQDQRVSQTELAARISTSQSQIARVESGDVDVRMSTVTKMAAALGKRIEWSLIDADPR